LLTQKAHLAFEDAYRKVIARILTVCRTVGRALPVELAIQGIAGFAESYLATN
jgi:hypothetical protein